MVLPASQEAPVGVDRALPYFASFVGIGLAGAIVGPSLPGLAAQTGSTLAAVSVLFSTRSAGFLIGALAAGRLYDRLPAHRIMALAWGIVAAALLLVPQISSLTLLVAIALIWGIGEAAVDVGGNTLVPWTYGARSSPFMNALHSCYGLGSFVAPLLIGQALVRSGNGSPVYTTVGLLIIPLAVWLLFRPSPRPLPRSTSAGSGNAPVGLIALIAFFLMLYVGVEIAFGGWVFTYATRLGLASNAGATALNAAFWGAFTVGRLISIPLATRATPISLLAGGLAGGLASLVLIGFIPGSRAALWGGTVALGLTMGPIFASMITLSGRLTHASGQMTSWLLVGASLGSMTVPWMVGQLIDGVGTQYVMLAILAVLALAALVFGLLYLRYVRSPAPVTEPAIAS